MVAIPVPQPRGRPQRYAPDASPLPGTFWNSRAGVGELGRVAGDVGRYRHPLREPLGQVNLSWGSASLALSVTRLVGVG